MANTNNNKQTNGSSTSSSSNINMFSNSNSNIRMNKQLVQPVNNNQISNGGQYGSNTASSSLTTNSTKSTPSLASAYFPSN
jgi:hypothetical protein